VWQKPEVYACPSKTSGLRFFLLNFLELHRGKLLKASEHLATYGSLNVVVKQDPTNLVLVVVIVRDPEGKVLAL